MNTEELTIVISQMLVNIEKGDTESLRYYIKKIVPTYSFNEQGKTLKNGHKSVKEYVD